MMRRRATYKTGLAGLLLAIVLCVTGPGRPPDVLAATNEATDPGGGGVVLTPSGPVTVNSMTLSLVKQARTLAGAVLPGGSNVAAGQEIYFVLYVDNPAGMVSADQRITDLLDETAFGYVAGTLAYTTVPSGSSNAAIWAGAWTALTDAVGGADAASIMDTGGLPDPDRLTVGAVPVQVNQTVSIPANTLWAVRFRVLVK